MAESDKTNGGIKFIWKIVNFSSIEGGNIQSPPFPWSSTKWDIIIHLTDTMKGGDSLSVELHQLQEVDKNLYCSFAFLDSHGYPLVWKERGTSFSYPVFSRVPCRNSLIFENFINRNVIFGSRRNEFLPNDILTLQCLIWPDSYGQFIGAESSLIARTQIEPLMKVTKKSFTWDIADASILLHEIPDIEHTESLRFNGEILEMKFLLSYDNEFEVKISVSLFRIHLKLTISLLEISGKKVQFVDEEFQFTENGQEWNVRTQISEHLLMCYRNAFLHGETLSLHFSCTLSGNVTFNSLLDVDETVNSALPSIDVDHMSEINECTDEPENETVDHSGTLSKDFQDMYEEGYFSDFQLRVEDRIFFVHKAVLGMRSTVFRETLPSEEGTGKFFVIDDVDGDTLHRMLQFIYSDKVEEDNGWESDIRLYDAARRYRLETLYWRCSAILRAGLCAESALDILILGDRHDDDELKSAAVEFISLKDNEIIGSERWSRFERENKQLAFDTFRSLYSHLKKRMT